MMKSLWDHRDTPAVAVLLSGDGGFKETLVRMLDGGWGVEILSFSKGFSSKLQQIATGSGGRGHRHVRLVLIYPHA